MNIKIKSCIECPNHKVIGDPDPNDWFNDDDKAVVCKLTPNPTNKPSTFYAGGNMPFKASATSVRPYNLTKETSPPPKWCPLKK